MISPNFQRLGVGSRSKEPGKAARSQEESCLYPKVEACISYYIVGKGVFAYLQASVWLILHFSAAHTDSIYYIL